MNNSGIYCIRNIVNNKIYYGSTNNFRLRWRSHKNHLIKGIHINKHLQASYNKYGETSFEYTIIIYCEIKDLLFFEQQFLDFYFDAGKNCYNIAKNATASFLGKTHTEESKKRCSDSKLGVNNPNFGSHAIPSNCSFLGRKHTDEWRQAVSGRKHSEETKNKMSICNKGSSNPRSKLTEDSVRVIILSTDKSLKDLAIEYNVAFQTISDIKLGKRWNHIFNSIIQEKKNC